MELLLVIVNSVLRPRRLCFCLQACVILLLLVALVVYMLTVSQSTVVPVSHDDLTSNNLKKTTGNAIKCVLKAPVNIKKLPTKDKHHTVPTIFAITTTRRHLTQLPDLTSLCQTLMNVEHLMWIVVENLSRKSAVVTDLLSSCEVNSVHLTLPKLAVNASMSLGSTNLKRGIREKNVGLEWIRQYCTQQANCSGVVYFLDEESKYDLRLFELMRKVKCVGVWPVAFAGKMTFEGPVCVNGSSVEWHALPSLVVKPFPISSIGFAISIHCLMDHPKALFGYAPESLTKSVREYEESDYLRNFLKDRFDVRLQCMGSNKEVHAWQVKSQINTQLQKHDNHWKHRLRT